MRQRLYRDWMIAAVILLLVTGVVLSYAYYFQIQSNTKDELAESAGFLTYINAYNISNLKSEKTRVTIVEKNGTVSYDSDHMTATLGNLNDLPEIIGARKTGEAFVQRYSEVDKANEVYYAAMRDDGSIIRLARPASSVYGIFVEALRNIIIIIMILFVASYFAIGLVVRRITSPINTLDLTSITIESSPYPEFDSLINTIILQREKLNSKISQLQIRSDMVMAIVSHMQEGLVIIDNSGILISANRGVFEIFDLDVNFSYRNISEVVSDIDLLEKVEATIAGAHIETDYQRLDKYYKVYMSPLKDVGAIIIFFDTTGTRNADRLRMEFTANVSHELRTPLTTISGYAEMIESGLAKPEDIKDFANKINIESGRLLNLIQDIIVLSTLDENPTLAYEDRINLSELAQRIDASLELKASEKNVTTAVDDADAVIMGKESMIFVLLYNLMENAIKYNKKGGSTHTKFIDEQDSVTVIVSDTGPGISKSHQERVFERFYRVENSRGKATGGTGLGLAIAYNIAEAHGGKLSVRSTPRKGTEFTAVLPKHLK